MWGGAELSRGRGWKRPAQSNTERNLLLLVEICSSCVHMHLLILLVYLNFRILLVFLFLISHEQILPKQPTQDFCPSLAVSCFIFCWLQLLMKLMSRIIFGCSTEAARLISGSSILVLVLRNPSRYLMNVVRFLILIY